MIDYTQILIRKYPNSLWSLNGDDYDGLTWVSETPKPSKKTLDGLWQEVQDLIEAEAEAKAQAKTALLERLGLTQEEFNTLIA